MVVQDYLNKIERERRERRKRNKEDIEVSKGDIILEAESVWAALQKSDNINQCVTNSSIVMNAVIEDVVLGFQFHWNRRMHVTHTLVYKSFIT